MSELHLPLLELSLVIPLLGAAWVSRFRDADHARRWSVGFHALALLVTVGVWQNFGVLHTSAAHDHWDVVAYLSGRELLVVDEISAPLLPLISLLYLLTAVATPRTKLRRFSFAWALMSQSLILATFSCREPWLLVGLLAAGTAPPFFELRARGKPTRLYVVHMILFILLLITGWAFTAGQQPGEPYSVWSIVPLMAAVAIRSGLMPFHSWMTDLFEHATFGTALLVATSMTGAYAAVRLLFPIVPDWALSTLGIMSLATAVYASGMALVQREARRFFAYLFLSNSALVLVGLESANEVAIAGALCVWISIVLSLGGFGLTLRAIEARTGRLSLTEYHGLYDHTPTLASFFLLTGLASVGFPGTFGFVGGELLVDGAVQAYAYPGMAVVAAAALNGIAVLQVYFLIFTGRRHPATVSLRRRRRESFAVLTLALLILGGGLHPQPGVASRFHAAGMLFSQRNARVTTTPAKQAEADHAAWPLP